MILNVPNDLNEKLLDEVAKFRKKGQKVTKELLIQTMIKLHYD